MSVVGHNLPPLKRDVDAKQRPAEGFRRVNLTDARPRRRLILGGFRFVAGQALEEKNSKDQRQLKDGGDR